MSTMILVMFLFATIVLQLTLTMAQSSDNVPSESEPIIVQTKYGSLRGFSIPLKKQPSQDDEHMVTRANIFLGVPYAQPPIGELRFEKPVEPKLLDAQIHDATKYAPSCPVADMHQTKLMTLTSNDITFNEDCLYLNIFAPVSGKKKQTYPIAFVIHGGGFEFGAAREFRWDFFAEQYVSQGIVIVTVAYRLGSLGFAATGDKSFAGNYGLWDQAMALRYVHNNIDAFGGDPTRLTVWGHSAGGASASALSLSPHTRDLIAGAIVMSGSVFAEWAMSNRVITETEKLAREVGCHHDLVDSKKLKHCLRQKTTQELQVAVNKQKRHLDSNFIRFAPRLDADFFPDDFIALFADSKIPTIVGACDAEFLSFGFIDPNDAIPSIFWNDVSLTPKNIEGFNEDHFKNIVDQFIITERLFGHRTNEARRMLTEFYLGTDNKHHGRDFYLAKYIELFSDLEFLVPLLIETKHKIRAGWPIYLYFMDYAKRSHLPQWIPIDGSFHAIEYPVMFGISFLPERMAIDRQDRAFQNNLVGAIVSFIKTGNPSTPLLPWEQANNKQSGLVPYTLLNDHAKLIPSQLQPEKMEFWERMRSMFDFDLIRSFHKKTLRSKDEL